MERVATARWLCSVLASVCVLSLSTAAVADEFFTNFDTLTDVNTADTFTVMQGSLSVDFVGATVYANPSLAQSPSKSWMIDPVGVRGSLTGVATATLSEGATRLVVYGLTEGNGVAASVQVFDEAGLMIAEGSPSNFNWAGLTVVRDPDAGDSLIKSVQISNTTRFAFENLRIAIDDFEFSTGTGGPGEGAPEGDEEGDGFENSSTSLATGPFVLFLLGAGWYFASTIRRRR